MRKVAVALLHHPVLNRAGEVFTTTLTNLDLHDISRCVRTYGLEAFFVVHPFAAQRAIAERMQQHWRSGPGGKRIPDRAEALSVLRVVPDVAAAEAELGGEGPVERWTTAAKARGAVSTWGGAREVLATEGPPVMLCFGTGWGLSQPFLDGASRRLPPIDGRGSDYNHLSVRAACAITLDRLFWPGDDADQGR